MAGLDTGLSMKMGKDMNREKKSYKLKLVLKASEYAYSYNTCSGEDDDGKEWTTEIYPSIEYWLKINEDYSLQQFVEPFLKYYKTDVWREELCDCKQMKWDDDNIWNEFYYSKHL